MKQENKRIPSMVDSGVFIPQEGGVSVLLPQGDLPGLFSTTDGDSAIAYGILGLHSRYGYPLNFSEVYKSHGIRPEWWHAALLVCGRALMEHGGMNIPYSDATEEPPIERTGEWARTFFLNPNLAPKDLSEAKGQAWNFIQSMRLATRKNWSNPKRVIDSIKQLQDLFDNPLKEAPTQGDGDGGGDGDGDAPSAESAMQLLRVLNQTIADGSSFGRGAWGDMRMLHPPLTIPVKEAITKLRPRPGFSGAFRYPLRAAIPAMDGRAFGEKRRVTGGTVLVDVSGSMDITSSQVEEAILQRPGLLVASYGEHEDEGRLRIIARNGRMVGEIPTGGCNICDGPALRWLGKQRAPRIWISDGHVNGRDHQFHPRLHIEAIGIVNQFRVIRFATLEQYLSAKSSDFRR